MPFRDHHDLFAAFKQKHPSRKKSAGYPLQFVKAVHSLAEVISTFGTSFDQSPAATPYIQKTLRAIRTCRTAVMGGHVDVCSNTACKHVHISYNSCRNRHCPTCQSSQKERWLTTMQYRTLPVSYFHCVFTIPHEFNGLCIRYPKLMYDLLFKVAWACIDGFSKHPQYGIEKTGMTSVLHTWAVRRFGQNLSLHPHLHCIIPAGGLAKNKHWKHLKGSKSLNKKNKAFLFPMEQLKDTYKSKFMAALRKLIKLRLIEQQEPGFLNYMYSKEWVVYAKSPFGGAQQVIEYLGRYTHKVAISNHRIQKIDTNGVQFAYKDYADKGKTKSMTLAGEEFLRRFCQHILPIGFTKVRHYGLHAGANQYIMDELHQELYCKPRESKLKETWQEIALKKTGYIEAQCPKCSQNTLQTVGMWHTNKPPPYKYKHLIINTY